MRFARHWQFQLALLAGGVAVACGGRTIADAPVGDGPAGNAALDGAAPRGPAQSEPAALDGGDAIVDAGDAIVDAGTGIVGPMQSPAPPAKTAPAQRLRCGNAQQTTTCAVGTEVCCLDLAAGTGTCLAAEAGAPSCSKTLVTCGRAADCAPSQVCCMNTDDDDNVTSTTCVAESACPSNPSHTLANLCDPAGSDCSVFGLQGRCAPSHGMSGYFSCAFGF
jgi:hypothetical protein